jgi:uncharacterized phage protein gp47/JayE
MTNIPTISQLYASILSDLETRYDINIPVFGKVFLRALAGVQAAKLKLLYVALGKVQKNAFPDLADSERDGGTLERYGRGKIGRNPFPASQGKYNVTVTGMFGGIIEAQTTFRSDDTAQNPGKLFILDTTHTMTSTSNTITLRALESGVNSRLSIGDLLTATAPIINVDAGVTVVSAVVIPNDEEDIEDYRSVIMQSYRLEAQGGAPADYRLWGLDAAGVKQIYPYAASGAPNEMNIFVEAVLVDSTDGMGTPTITILNDVDAAIEADPETGRGRVPMGIWSVNVLPVVINQIFITIHGFTLVTPAQKTLILQALTDEVELIRPFIAGADVLANRRDTLSVNNVVNVILTTVPGAVFTMATMAVKVGFAPPVSETSKLFDNGNIPFLTSINYV